MSDIGERLRKERQRLGYSQQIFAGFGGVARNAQSNYEKGARQPDATYLALVAGKGVDIQYVLTGQRKETVATEPLSGDESALLNNYRHLDHKQKQAVFQVSETMNATYDPEPDLSDPAGQADAESDTSAQ